jgi:hypothetical protein
LVRRRSGRPAPAFRAAPVRPTARCSLRSGKRRVSPTSSSARRFTSSSAWRRKAFASIAEGRTARGRRDPRPDGPRYRPERFASEAAHLVVRLPPKPACRTGAGGFAYHFDANS